MLQLLSAGHPTDGALLECFVARRDELAFAELVRRHGPMVLGVCRRLLRHREDAEDAFQAAFLVLARKAASVVPRESVAGWLYGVACRTALGARARRSRRAARERQGSDIPERAKELRTLKRPQGAGGGSSGLGGKSGSRGSGTTDTKPPPSAPGTFKVFRLKYAPAQDVAVTLEKMLPGNLNHIVADKRTNQLLVQAPAESLLELAKILQVLDVDAGK